ncbi:hypothetical protein DVK85_12105 [Flavobacterium arcticum]|uniref:Uncharacterized protein n=1 Tax=Flavobacterium arcticum TaxID=1784713 RepID=A0A345HEB9_9FLAO|nr:hypothetical protein [Flavobacterium arcticum]AXG74929.1 hypothetical protein DVK85_12105 [Flavobacterium arcticum]KAF2506483.1 hypothetical protein E0W72_12680 [Flavobacterium arcticum]
MKLKMLISIKFVIHITGLVAMYFIIMPAIDYYHDLEHENERLWKLTELNSKLDNPDYKDPRNQTAILEEIDFLTLRITRIDKRVDASDRIFYLMIFIYLFSAISNSLENKINEIKAATNDTGELL